MHDGKHTRINTYATIDINAYAQIRTRHNSSIIVCPHSVSIIIIAGRKTRMDERVNCEIKHSLKQNSPRRHMKTHNDIDMNTYMHIHTLHTYMNTFIWRDGRTDERTDRRIDNGNLDM